MTDDPIPDNVRPIRPMDAPTPIPVDEVDVEVVTLADPGHSTFRRRERNSLVARCTHCGGVIARRLLGPWGRSVWLHSEDGRRECNLPHRTWRDTIPTGPDTV